MGTMDQANLFFDACETGKGWEGCKAYCNSNASFTCQADALADVTTVESYCEWMKGLFTPVPDGRYELKTMSHDENRNIVTAYAVFHGTNTVDGPVPATNKTVAGDYVYAMHFEDGKLSHLTKIWNDVHSLKQLGWA